MPKKELCHIQGSICEQDVQVQELHSAFEGDVVVYKEAWRWDEIILL